MLLGSEAQHSAAGGCSASPPARITVHLNGLSPDLVPVPADKRREWWEEDPKTAQHARHCLPLLMANSLGYFILSPGAFRVAWSGEPGEDAVVEPVDQRERFSVDNHSAHGSFTVQPGFIPTTSRAGDFLLIKGIANLRRPWFTVMEALIETWWQPGDFGIVCLLHGRGEHTIRRGEPLAQMLLYRAEGGVAGLEVSPSLPVETGAWRARRHRADYQKDFDYMRGRHPNGTVEPTHTRSWSTSQRQGFGA
jgi:hypothetical protein